MLRVENYKEIVVDKDGRKCVLQQCHSTASEAKEKLNFTID